MGLRSKRGKDGTDSKQRWESTKQTLVVLIALSVILSTMVVGAIAAPNHQDSDSSSDDAQATYSVQQGEECFTIAPVTANKSALEFYDYRTPFEDNPYTNTTGESYSSEGTVELQRANESTFFLYEDSDGNLSVVFVHGMFNETQQSQGGSVSFNITGLPEEGNWTVKDDEYNGTSNYDNWSHNDTAAQVDWTWKGGGTDGGAYTGLGDNFTITVDPAFNEEAALFGQHYDGTVQNWTAVSNESGEYNRTTLDLSEPVNISTQDCSRLTGSVAVGDAAGGDDDRDKDDKKDEKDDDRDKDDKKDEKDDDRDKDDKKDEKDDDQQDDDQQDDDQQDDDQQDDDQQDDEEGDEEEDDGLVAGDGVSLEVECEALAHVTNNQEEPVTVTVEGETSTSVTLVPGEETDIEVAPGDYTVTAQGDVSGETVMVNGEESFSATVLNCPTDVRVRDRDCGELQVQNRDEAGGDEVTINVEGPGLSDSRTLGPDGSHTYTDLEGGDYTVSIESTTNEQGATVNGEGESATVTVEPCDDSNADAEVTAAEEEETDGENATDEATTEEATPEEEEETDGENATDEATPEEANGADEESGENGIDEETDADIAVTADLPTAGPAATASVTVSAIA